MVVLTEIKINVVDKHDVHAKGESAVASHIGKLRKSDTSYIFNTE